MKIALHHYQRIVSAKRFMDQNFHENIDLETVSRQVYLSRFHFHRLFTHIYRRTPHQYITRVRLEKAKELLSNDDKTVGEVCYEVGFESLGSFSTLFKKEIGYAPQYYRNMAWLKKQQAREQPKAFIPHCFIETFGPDQ